MLRISNLVKKYGKFTAVDNLSMEIEKGHIFGFVGENGAGKTTTMKIAAGLLSPTSGEITVAGVNMFERPREAKKMIGYMPDFFGVYDDLKVEEYMDFYSGIYGIPYRERKTITDQLLELVDLVHKKGFYVDSLSRGMKQRLCLARSLIHNPQLLILDEPASGLDPRARVEMKNILRELKNMGKTILISSHILSELSEMCTVIGIISQGKMVACGTVDEITGQLVHSGRLRIKTGGNIDEAIKILQEQPSIRKININGDIIEADTSADENTLSQILRTLVLRNVPVVSFSHTGGSLESVFMKLTDGGNGDDA